MEPKRACARPNVMLADTSAIHAYGAAQARHAAELEAITSTLTAATARLPADAFGAVGVRFLAAMAEAVTTEAGNVARLGERVAAAGATAHTTADAYVASERGAGRAISGLET